MSGRPGNPVRGKLLFVVLVATSLALVISGAAMVIYELRDFRQTWVDDLTAQADVIGLAAAPALQFEDPDVARDYLALLEAKPNITGAAIYAANGSLFASYSTSGQEVTFPSLPDVDGHQILENELVLFKRIVADDEILGTVALRANYDLTGRLLDYLGMLGVIMLLSLAGAVLVSGRLRSLNAELEDRVAARTAQLEAANKELESFSYSVSHDLRAPLRAINGFANLLWEDHKDRLDEEAQRKISIIRGQADRMGTLIDDLLTFSRLGRKSIEPVELDMKELATNAFERLGGDDVDGKTELRVGKLPTANADRNLLEQVWSNLLSNAVKFSSRKEHPVVEVGGIVGESENVYYVRDNGAGFDPRYQGKLFGVFQRLHDESEYPGTGVGLALVHRIITRHGGRVWADSQPGDGATFHFSLPKDVGHG